MISTYVLTSMKDSPNTREVLDLGDNITPICRIETNKGGERIIGVRVALDGNE